MNYLKLVLRFSFHFYFNIVVPIDEAAIKDWLFIHILRKKRFRIITKFPKFVTLERFLLF